LQAVTSRPSPRIGQPPRGRSEGARSSCCRGRYSRCSGADHGQIGRLHGVVATAAQPRCSFCAVGAVPDPRPAEEIFLVRKKNPPGRRHVPAREHAPRSGPARYGGRGRPAEEPGDWHLSGRRSRVVPGLSARVGPAQRRRDPRRRSHPRRYRLRSIGGSRPTW